VTDLNVNAKEFTFNISENKNLSPSKSVTNLQRTNININATEFVPQKTELNINALCYQPPPTP
jgi:hypothetical protein